MGIIVLFAACTLANVILSTIKTVMTVKGSKISAAIWNALSFGLYTYIVVLTATADLTTFEKIAITVICNLIGVYTVKLVEEKMRKDRLWKIEMTVPAEHATEVFDFLKAQSIPCNYIEGIGKYTIVNAYASTKEQTAAVEEICEAMGAKLFASETALAP